MNITLKEKLDRIVNKDPEELCKLCIYENDCIGITSGGNGEPIFPPCSESDYDVFIDESLLEEYEEDIE